METFCPPFSPLFSLLIEEPPGSGNRTGSGSLSGYTVLSLLFLVSVDDNLFGEFLENRIVREQVKIFQTNFRRF